LEQQIYAEREIRARETEKKWVTLLFGISKKERRESQNPWDPLPFNFSPVVRRKAREKKYILHFQNIPLSSLLFFLP
jgi:hypothetical protein